jgi:hypothetical protein
MVFGNYFELNQSIQLTFNLLHAFSATQRRDIGSKATYSQSNPKGKKNVYKTVENKEL